MDADGSHAPEQLPELLAALADADLVLGSRYVPGGAVTDWPAYRLLLSRAGNRYTRWALRLPLNDATGGFRAARAELIDRLPFDDVASQGYCFQVDWAWRAVRAGARVTEVPITFSEREFGRSKMSGSIVREALVRVTVWGLQDRLADWLPEPSAVPYRHEPDGGREAVRAADMVEHRDRRRTPGAACSPGCWCWPSCSCSSSSPAWIGVGWTILATLATSAIGWALLARQGTKALADLRERARSRQPAGRELGDAGLVAAGGLLMVLPGFIGDLVGLLCLLPGTRNLVRGALTSSSWCAPACRAGAGPPVRVESVADPPRCRARRPPDGAAGHRG